jgi:hypothetical protein
MTQESATPQQKRVLTALQDSSHTWEELRALTKLNDERLGFTVLELLNLRLIWTQEKNEVRRYALERRVGLVPRFQTERRASERRVMPA